MRLRRKLLFCALLAYAPAVRAGDEPRALRLRTAVPLRVFIEHPDGTRQDLGVTPAPHGRPLVLPPDGVFWVAPVPKPAPTGFLPPTQAQAEQVIAEVKRLKLPRLSLRGCGPFLPQLIDDVCTLEHLQGLDLGYTQLGDWAALDLRALHELEVLYLNATGISGAGLRNIAQLKRLRVLNLADCLHVTDGGLKVLHPLRTLQTLDLTRCPQVTGKGLKHLLPLPLRELQLGGTAVTGRDLDRLSEMKELRVLGLHGSPGIADTALQWIAGIETLEVLDLSATQIGGPGLPQLHDLPRLHTLDLSDCQRLSDFGLTHLESLDQVRHLRLRKGLNQYVCALQPGPLSSPVKEGVNFFSITSVGMEHLQRMGGLEVLDLTGLMVDDVGMRHVARLQRLRELYVGFTRVSDRGVRELTALESLEVLGLNSTLVTDRCLRELKALPALHTLDLAYTIVSNAGLGALRDLEALRRLDLSGTRISDAGLSRLADVKQLEELDLYVQGVSRGAAEDLSAKLPRCVVRFGMQSPRLIFRYPTVPSILDQGSR